VQGKEVATARRGSIVHAGSSSGEGADQDADERRLLAVVGGLATELHRSAPAVPVQLDSQLESEVGLDSLALVELRARVEQAFGVTLPDRVLAAATPGNWLLTIHEVRKTTSRPSGTGLRIEPSTAERARQPGVETPSALVPRDAQSLPEVVAWHARSHPEQVHLRVLSHTDDEATVDELTYGALNEEAAVVAGGLRHHGLARGEAVAVMLPTSRDYFCGFMGILFGGAVPVPIYPPARAAGLEDHLRRQAHILQDARAVMLITDPAALALAELLRSQVPTLRAVVTVEELRASAAGPLEAPCARGEELALIQYTSGSTGHPKGVVLAHRHLLANIAAMGSAASVTSSDVFVSWLPLYHDMGLIAAWLGSLCLSLELVVMPPFDFLARPGRWLRAIDAYRGTITASPNFGFELCIRYVTDAEIEGLDLSSWRLAFNGAEPVSPETIRRFTERFGNAGFHPAAMTPVYGLAEAGVALTFPPLGRGPKIDLVDREVLATVGAARPASPEDPAPQRFVACGRPLPGYEVRVVDPSHHELADRHEGRIEFAGPSATPGYFANPQATARLRHDGWLDTGDLGYMADGDLYLTGRAKDIVIRAGRNLHPEELEEAVGCLDGVRKGCVAVFSSPDPQLGTERLVVMAETRLGDPADLAGLRTSITATTVEVLGTPPDDVVLAPPGTVPKTSSGKIRRSASRDLYEGGDMSRARPTRSQVARIALRTARVNLRRLARVGAGFLYAGYAWTLAAVVGAVVWLAVMTLPTLEARWAVLRRGGTMLRRLAGVDMIVSGTVPAGGPYVIVANHASFIDGLVLALCLRSPATFVASEELAAQRVAGPFLRRLGCQFVQRGEPRAVGAEAEGFARSLRGGRNLIFFPEGWLQRAPGLRPFHLGAFVAAGQSGVPVVPIGLRGTRDIVRPGRRFPRRGSIQVAIGAPVAPVGGGWSDALVLRDEARAAVRALAGEVDLETSGG
jgi:1-acyl-sn-glycerol-3-phosphate acyltransferase